MVLHDLELNVLFHKLRNGLYTQVFCLLVIHSDFKTGEVLTNYARLADLCSPPAREKGGRGKGPTERQIRYAVEQLIEQKIVKRNAQKNEAQGMLRLYVRKRTGATKK
ncbi:MAG: hypothetical protein U5M53_13785 [Rhodoferax sp.]|nr:hypothetical protein [Rhodoferax sp.]